MRGVVVVVLLTFAVSGCEITFGTPQEDGQTGAATEPDNPPAPEPDQLPEPEPAPKPEPAKLKTQKIANQFANLIAKEIQGSVTVKCPKSVPFKVGGKFDCKVTGDASGPIHVTIDDKRGNVDANFDDVTAGA